MKFQVFNRFTTAQAPQERTSSRPAPLRNRSFVAVYDDACRSRFIAYAQIVDHEWCPIPGAYSYDVNFCQNRTGGKAWDFHTRPVDANEIRQLFVLIRNPADRS